MSHIFENAAALTADTSTIRRARIEWRRPGRRGTTAERNQRGPALLQVTVGRGAFRAGHRGHPVEPMSLGARGPPNAREAFTQNSAARHRSSGNFATHGCWH
jgi:hypothetical protein